LVSISYEKRQKIIAQALQEIVFAREYKQSKTKNWKTNEDMYYSRKSTPSTPVQTSSRANVDLGQMASHVHTILSKIDTPLVFKFTKRKEAQAARVKQLNGLRIAEQYRNDWDIKDLAGKKQGVIYGRAIFSYYADSQDGYKSHLDNVDVYDFLIDPSAGGLDIERADYVGDYGVIKSRKQLKEGMKSGMYLKTETQILIEGSGNSTEVNQEELNKDNRTRATNVSATEKDIGNPDKYKFWRWGTTFEGERYYLLLSEKGGTAIEVTPIKEKFESELWWYWTWAAFVDLTEFWTPGYCDYARELFMAQAISINQMLDNGEQINKPQKVVNVGYIENLAELKYRRDGIIRVKKDFDIAKAVQNLSVPSIDTPLRVFEKLESLQDRTSGVTAGSQGAAPNNSGSKLGIYQGNEENSADRFGLLNRSYSFGYKRFAKLFEFGVREHLIQKIAVDILGPDGVEIVSVSRRDLFRKSEDFGVMVESSNAEIAMSQRESEAKISFLQGQASIVGTPGQPPAQNSSKAYEIMAGIVGFDEETIRQLKDTSDYGNEQNMSEAERDIENILDGKKVQPNQASSTAYKQRFIDYMQEQQENISADHFKLLADYVLLLDPIIERNMTRQANAILFKAKMQAILNPAPVEQAPIQNSGI